MLTTIFLALLCGLSLGMLLTVLFLGTIKVKCPKCKQLKPLRQIIIFQWKSRQITGQPCLKCRQIKPQVEIF